MKTIIKVPIISEKAAKQITQGKYLFETALDANKIEIRQFIEKKYKVDVIKVNVINQRGKKRRRGKSVGMTSRTRKAFVTLKDGQIIEEMKALF